MVVKANRNIYTFKYLALAKVQKLINRYKEID